MQELSERLYNYLCYEVVGTESMVKYRRQFFEIFDDVQNSDPMINKKVTYVSSGSKAEGLDPPGSDYDVMFVSNLCAVYEKPINCEFDSEVEGAEKKDVLIMDTEHAQPGFVCLRIPKPQTWPPELIMANEYGTYLSGKLVRSLAAFPIHHNNFFIPTKINGPCTTSFFDTMDAAFTLKCNAWPTIARQWLMRPRTSNWPPTDVVSKICNQGVLFVPIGSKSTSQEDNPFEWRISFSIPEKHLIYSWNHTQFLCYALLKIFVKSVVKKYQHVDKLICSYFLKTTIFWLSEENGPEMWAPKTLIRCFMSCLERLIYWNCHNFIPNYFIPEHNLIDRKIPGQPRDELVSVLCGLHRMGWRCILLCDSVREFMHWNQLTTIPFLNEFERSLFPLLQYIHIEEKSKSSRSKFLTSVKRATNRRLAIKIRYLFLFYVTIRCQEIAKSTFYNISHQQNKQNYRKQKQWMPYALMGTKTDSLSGWLLVALYFYTYKDYNKSLIVLDYCRLSLSMEKFTYTSSQATVNFKSLNKILPNLYRAAFCRNIRMSTMRSFELFTEPTNSNIDKDHSFLHPLNRQHCCPSTAFVQYLGVLCYHKLSDRRRCMQNLRKLVLLLQSEHNINDESEKAVSCLYLSRALEITGDRRSANYWRSVAKNICRSSSRISSYFTELRK